MVGLCCALLINAARLMGDLDNKYAHQCVLNTLHSGDLVLLMQDDLDIQFKIVHRISILPNSIKKSSVWIGLETRLEH